MNILGIIIKMGTYAVILFLVTLITKKTYESDSFVKERTIYSFEVDKELYAKIFLGIAIGMSLLILFVSSFPANVSGTMKYVTATIVIGINLFFYVLALYYFFDMVRIDPAGFYIRKGFFAKRKYSFAEISSCEYTESKKVILELVNGKKLTILSGDDDKVIKEQVVELFQRYGVYVKPKKEIYSVRACMLFVGGSILGIATASLMTVVAIIGQVFLGIMVFGLLGIVCVFRFLKYISNKIIVDGNVITVIRLFHRTKHLTIADIRSKKIKMDERLETTYVYGEQGVLFTYNNYDINEERMGEIMENVPVKK